MVARGYSEFIADVVYITLELAIAILAIAGNILVCWAVCLNSNLQNVTNYFVASLAVADVAVGVLAIPFAIAISTGFCASFYVCLFITCFVLVLTQSSIFSLLAIAIDRIIAIRMPLRYNALVTGSRAKCIIAICWVLSFIIGLTPMLGWHRRPTGAEKGTDENGSSSFPPSDYNCSHNMMPCYFEEVVTMEYMVYYNFFACVLVPLLLMFGIYLKIFMAARRQLKQIGNKMAHGERSCSILQKEVHAAKSLAIIVGLFAICWLPLHIINCYTLFCQGCGRPPLWLMYVAILLSHANSVVNPLIYAYRIREFRHTFRKIIGQRVLCQTARLRPASQKNSLHNGENGEHTSIRVGEYGLNFFSNGDETDDVHADSNLVKGKASTEWHQEMNGLDGEANGHIGRYCYRNGDISGAAKKGEQVSQELLGYHESYTELETSAFEGSSVS